MLTTQFRTCRHRCSERAWCSSNHFHLPAIYRQKNTQNNYTIFTLCIYLGRA